MAAPNPPSTPGFPVPSYASPANVAPLSPTPTVSVFGGAGVAIPVLP